MSLSDPNHYLIFVCLLFMIFVNSCVFQNDDKQQALSFDYIQNDTLLNTGENTASLYIKNPHSEKINIRFSYNQKFWFTKTDVIKSITSMETDDIPGLSPSAAKSWIFAMQNTYAGNNTHLPETSVQLPSVFLNSTGAGICDDRSYFLHKLWQLKGYKSRIWYLDGHVVPEVYDDTWKMLDVHYNLFFEKQPGVIAGVHDLENSISDYDLRFCQDAPAFLILPAYYSRIKYYDLFTTNSNNTCDESSACNWFDTHITLPRGAALSFPFYPDSVDYHAIGKLHIPGHYTGTIALPFTVHRIENAFIAGVIADDMYKNLPAGEYVISGKDCTVYFYVNALLTASSAKNTLEIRKDKDIKLVTGLSESQFSQKMETFIFFRAFFPKIVYNHMDFFENMANIRQRYPTSTFSCKNEQELTDSIKAIYKAAANSSFVPDSMLRNLASLEQFIAHDKNNIMAHLQNPDALFYVTWISTFLPENKFRFLLSEHIANN